MRGERVPMSALRWTVHLVAAALASVGAGPPSLALPQSARRLLESGRVGRGARYAVRYLSAQIRR